MDDLLLSRTENQVGVIYARRPRGVKLHFVMGGAIRSQAHLYIDWKAEHIGKWVYVHVGEDTFAQLGPHGVTMVAPLSLMPRART